MIGTKMSRESLVRIGQMRDRLLYFRSNCFTYTALASPRMLYMAFAVVMTPVGGSMGTRALAAVFFLLFLLGIGGLATYAIHLRLGFGRFAVRQNRILILHEPWLRVAPLICFVTWSNLKEEKLPGRQIGSISFFRILYHDENVDRVTTSAADYNLSEVQRGWQNKLQEAEKDMAPIQPSFSVISVRRVSKIEDEDEDETILEALASDPNRASRPMRLGRRKSHWSLGGRYLKGLEQGATHSAEL
ncbi:hypothetical protein F5883DRAFT_618702 [Diaporthe sp. PMI_573]|nr:hypothetical protein F5883DRAFT_618702 [Diaporthaceae sp. PMI_573]